MTPGHLEDEMKCLAQSLPSRSNVRPNKRPNAPLKKEVQVHRITNTGKLGENADATPKSTTAAVHHWITGMRPQMSARGPKTKVPRKMPSTTQITKWSSK